MSEQSTSQTEIDAEILRLSHEGLSQLQIAGTLTRNGTPIAQTTVGRRLRLMGEAPVGLSPARRAVLTKLAEASRALDPDDLAIGALTKQLVPTLHALRKAGMVTFVQTTNAGAPSGHHQTVKRIEITDKGRFALRPAAVPHVEIQPGHAVIRDDVKTAPLDKFLARPTVDTFLMPPRPTCVSDAPDDDGTSGQDRESDESVEAIREAFTVVAEPEITPDSQPEAETPSWPVLDRLRDRTTKVHMAAKLLEEAGLDDAALAALDALKFTDLEREYLAFADACQR